MYARRIDAILPAMRAPLNILYNFHWIEPGEAARSAQPYLGLRERFLVSNGIRGLINLRGAHPDWGWWRNEARTCRRNGIAHFDTPLNSRLLPTRAMLTVLLDAFDAAPRPFLIKCSGGQDRTSFAAALFVVHRHGWGAVEQARGQFRRLPYLHFPKPCQRWLAAFLDFAQAQAAGRPLGEWARHEYDPERLRTWLNAHDMAGSFENVFQAD